MQKLVCVLSSFFLCISLFSQEFEWVKPVNSPSIIRGVSVSVDLQGNIITTGEAYPALGVDFDPGPDTHELDIINGVQCYVQKLDSSGNFLWAITLRGENAGSKTTPRIMETDDDGNIYITGTLIGGVDFDPGPEEHFVYGGSPWDMFLLKLDAEGNFQWCHTVGDNSFNRPADLAVGADGVFLTGSFDGTIDFDPGPDMHFETANPADGGQDSFIRKVDFDGNFIWVKIMDTYEVGMDLHFDNLNNLYISGRFLEEMDANPLEEVAMLEVGEGEFGYFLTKLGPDETFDSAILFPAFITHMATDINENLYLSGRFTGEVDFDPGPGLDTYTTPDYVTYLVKFDSDQNFIWSNVNLDTGYRVFSAPSIDTLGHVYVSGGFLEPVDLAAGPEIAEFTPVGSADGYMMHIDSGGDFVKAYSFGSTGEDYVRKIEATPFGYLVITGGYMGSCDLNMGDGVEIIEGPPSWENMFVEKLRYECYDYSNVDTTTIVSCDSYIWDVTSDEYIKTGIYKERFKDVFNCDSILVLDYTRNIDSTVYPGAIACNEYIWEVNGETYTETGLYHAVLPNIYGCDSVISIDLTINSNDLSINRIGSTLKVNTWTADNYYWVDCNADFAIIDGEFFQEFEFDENGSYAVIVNKFGCIDTSDCFIVEDLGMDNASSLLGKISLYPNPNNGHFYLDIPEAIQLKSITLTNLLGTEIQAFQIEQIEGVVPFEIKTSTGVYLLRITDREDKSVNLKISVNH